MLNCGTGGLAHVTNSFLRAMLSTMLTMGDEARASGSALSDVSAYGSK
ncbi:hypothetical protein OAE29_05045 [Octadecabacter sp.]|nr:hypothetical protein [Octadecabacter sp.]